MVVKKGHIELLFSVLKDTKLNLAEARTRDAAMKELATYNNTFVEDRKKIFETFCTKDEEGKPKIEDNKYTFPPENSEALIKELETLTSEEVTIEGDIVPLIEKTEYSPKPGEVEIIDTFK